MELQQLIDKINEELAYPLLSFQRKRYLTEHLQDLILYQNNHPNETKVPSPLELYCNANPDALECRIYDD